MYKVLNLLKLNLFSNVYFKWTVFIFSSLYIPADDAIKGLSVLIDYVLVFTSQQLKAN